MPKKVQKIIGSPIPHKFSIGRFIVLSYDYMRRTVGRLIKITFT